MNIQEKIQNIYKDQDLEIRLKAPLLGLTEVLMLLAYTSALVNCFIQGWTLSNIINGILVLFQNQWVA